MKDRSHTAVLADLGLAVYLTQTVESQLSTLLVFVLQDGVPLTLERIDALDAVHRKKTLGYFVTELKKRASYYQPLEETIDRFLVNRNRIAHHIHEIPGFALETEEDVVAARQYLARYIHDVIVLQKFFAAWHRAWLKQTNAPDHLLDDARAFEVLGDWMNDITRFEKNINDYVYRKS